MGPGRWERKAGTAAGHGFLPGAQFLVPRREIAALFASRCRKAVPDLGAAGLRRRGGQPVPLHDTEANESDGEISPDGKWVAYVSAESGQLEVYAHPFPGPGGKERVSTQGGNSVRWSRNGREMFYQVSGAANPP